jgi:hypothetical protein
MTARAVWEGRKLKGLLCPHEYRAKEEAEEGRRPTLYSRWREGNEGQCGTGLISDSLNQASREPSIARSAEIRKSPRRLCV